MSSPDDQVHSFDDEDEYGEDDAGSDGDADEYGLDYDENDDDDEDFTSYEGAPLDRQTLAAMSSEEVKQILLDSIENANVDLVGSLIEVNCEVNIRDEGGVPALHLAAFEGFTSIAKMLLAAKADVNATDSHGQTALHAAISGGSAQLAQTLIKNGANVDAQDADGATALHYASYEGFEEGARLLLEYGASKSIIARAGSGSRGGTAADTADNDDIRLLILTTEFQWTCERHRYAPKALKQVVLTLALIRSLEPSNVLAVLPNELLFLICEYL